MKKILVILPKSIAGEIITEGFAAGFELNKCRVLKKNIDELKTEDLKSFKPDAIFGYDYSFLMDANAVKLVENSLCKNIVCYFADEPKGKFALGDKDCLYHELKKFNPKIFIWDRNFLEDFEDSTYLPLAINPEKYLCDFSGYRYDISFVGRPLTEGRQKILAQIIKVFKNKLSIFCYEKHFRQSIDEMKEKNFLEDEELDIYSKCWKGFIEKEEELAKVYSSSKVNLNINLQGGESINYRTFEVLASGGFLLTDERECLKEFFAVAKNLETYNNISDLIDKTDFYLKNPNIAQKIALFGKVQVLSNHTFEKRAKILLENIF